MSKKTIIIILIGIIVALGGFTLYSTFAYDENSSKLGDSSADYNLIYSLKETSKNQTIVSAGETKYIDIAISNTYTANVRYAIYYRLVEPNKMPDKVSISLAEESQNKLQDIIKPGANGMVSIKITNDSEYNVDLIIGAVVGFENGNIEELLNDNERLIK